MASVDTRQLTRDSFFLKARILVGDTRQEHSVRVRNISSGGLMAMGNMAVARGTKVIVELRHIGQVGGTVAWVQGERFGIAFIDEIDPKRVRAPVGTGEGDQRSDITRQYIASLKTDPGRMRKI